MSKLKALAGLGVMLLALMLTGCSGEPSPTDTVAPTAAATPTPTAVSTVAVTPTTVAMPTPAAVDTPTPVAKVQEGATLTTQEYAEALEEAASGLEEEGDDEIEAAFEALFSGDLISEDKLERLSALETSASWSEDDMTFASELAQTILQATTAVYDVILKVLNGFLDEMASLKPPEHLSDLHSHFIATYREVLLFIQEYVETVKNADTEIKSQEDLAAFYALINSLESGPLDPDLEQKGEDLTEQAEQACLELKEQLEAELERDVRICD